jgi:hypothetical protein
MTTHLLGIMLHASTQLCVSCSLTHRLSLFFPQKKKKILVLITKGSCSALTILISQVLMLMFIINSHTKTSTYNLNHLVSHEKLKQQNSFNLEPDNLALLGVQHWRKEVPRPDMSLSVTSSRHTDSVILPSVIWTVLSLLSYSHGFK